ncbi:MAG: BC1881 family protein [Holosporales bacterium]|jgi:hypothetical protein|nr:BC1881 family protein [Holosporales bacterium]
MNTEDEQLKDQSNFIAEAKGDMKKPKGEMQTCELVNKLRGREGVKEINVLPYGNYTVATETETLFDTGPAVILVITD